MSKLLLPSSIIMISLGIVLPVVSFKLQERRALRSFLGLLLLLGYGYILLQKTLLGRSYCGWRSLWLIEPLWSYRKCLSINGLTIVITDYELLCEIIINYLLYCPLSYLLPFLWQKFFLDCSCIEGILKITITVFLCSLLVEMAQVVTSVGFFETDDIFGNTVGASLGYMLYRKVHAIAG